MAGFSFKCKDVGVECGFEVKAAGSKEEIMQMIALHAKLSHKIETIPNELRSKVEQAIKS